MSIAECLVHFFVCLVRKTYTIRDDNFEVHASIQHDELKIKLEFFVVLNNHMPTDRGTTDRVGHAHTKNTNQLQKKKNSTTRDEEVIQ